MPNRTIFFLFYFNRLFAQIISYAIRAYTWHRYRVYIEIRALQISLLAGRVFFTGLRYHGNNETIFVHAGYITWRYWLRKTRHVDLNRFGASPHSRGLDKDGNNSKKRAKSVNGEEKGGVEKPSNLPCRLVVSLQGLEWFIYNRSMAYDSILASMADTDAANGKLKPHLSSRSQESNTITATSSLGLEQKSSPNSQSGMKKRLSHQASPFTRINKEGDGEETRTNADTESISLSPSELANHEQKQPNSILLDFLPVHIECNKGGIVMGNENTKSVVVTKFDTANGDIDATAASSLDSYRQLINFEFTNPDIRMRPNSDFKESQASAARRTEKEPQGRKPEKSPRDPLLFYRRQKHQAWHKLQNLIPYLQRSVESFSPGVHSTINSTIGQGRQEPDHWIGLSRYLVDSPQDQHDRWNSIEYAQCQDVFSCPQLRMIMYWDVAGTVRKIDSAPPEASLRSLTFINGAPSPEWGIDLFIEGGIVKYGPWTDRQRADLQNMFFPAAYTDAVPASQLKPGETRQTTAFKLFIAIDKMITIHIPTREQSKDSKWKNRAQASEFAKTASDGRRTKKRNKTATIQKETDRPFGWFDIKLGPQSTVNFTLDMLAGPNGYRNKLDIDLRDFEISTSVNHGLLLSSRESEIACDLSNPLEWNLLHKWKIDLTSDGLRLFLIRDHVFLLTDLVNDWTTGPPPDYYTFVPFQYEINFRLSNFRIYINVNDANIIDDPSSMDDNTFISIHGTGLNGDLFIPLDKYRPQQNEMTFNVTAHTGGLDLHVPPWNTQATFLDSKHVALLSEIALDGRYNYYTTTSPSLTDTLILDVNGLKLSVELYGFLIRYFLKIKDNYFGDDIHFKTFEEYKNPSLKDAEVASEPDLLEASHAKSNDLDVILSVEANDVSILLPANLYTATDNVRLDLTTVALDLRFTSYYMDLEVNFSPLSVLAGKTTDGLATPVTSSLGTQAFVNGVTIHGHRIFGLPPAEPTYVCNWDFTVGSVTGECSMEFLKTLTHSIRNLVFSFDDDENALPVVQGTVLHDVTFLRANVKSIRVWLRLDEIAFLVSTGMISFNFNDWAGHTHSGHFDAQIPNLVLACVDAASASRHKSRNHVIVKTHGYLQTDISVVMLERKLHFSEDRKLQQAHLRLQDQRTSRTPFLFREFVAGGDIGQERFVPRANPPAMPFPALPPPLQRRGVIRTDSYSDTSSVNSSHSKLQDTSRKSSFMSFSPSHSDRKDTSLQPSGMRVASTRSIPSLVTTHDGRSLPESEFQGSSVQDLSDARSRRSHSRAPPSRWGTGHEVQSSRAFPSSPFAPPYFPLESVEPSLENVPTAPNDVHGLDLPSDPSPPADYIRNLSFDEETTHNSFLVSLRSGLRAFVDPVTLRSIASFLINLQPKKPIDIIDDLQIDTTTKIFEEAKERRTTGRSIDLSLRVPYVRVRMINSVDAVSETAYGREDKDDYSLSLSQLALTARSGVSSQGYHTFEGGLHKSSLHLILDSVDLFVGEYSSNTDGHAAIRARADEIVFWAMRRTITVADFKCRRTELSTASKKIHYLAELIHRTTDLAETLRAAFLDPVEDQQQRLKYFAYFLTSSGSRIPDPSFLTRPSYILRSSNNHLRGNDSWKIVSRLRHIYNSLPEKDRHTISDTCTQGPAHCPDNAKTEVIKDFDCWRNNELLHATHSYAIERIYGPAQDTKQREPSKQHPLRVSISLSRLRCLIDPGPKQNEVTVDDLTIGLAINTPLMAPAQIPGPISSSASTMTVQVHASRTAIHLNWELYELAEDISRLYAGNTSPEGFVHQVHKKASNKSPFQSSSHYHFMVACDTGSVILETINLKWVMSSKLLEGSLIATQGAAELHGAKLHVLLHAQAGSTEVFSHSQVLSSFKMRSPSVYFSKDSTPGGDAPVHTIKLASSWHRISFDVQKEILVLIEVSELVLGDEIAQIYRLVNHLPDATTRPADATTEPKKSAVYNYHVALFLDAYSISFALLHSLTYVISGKGARTSIAPKQNSALALDFDINEHTHDVRTTTASGNQSISVLQMPPINGRIIGRMSSNENLIDLSMSVESILLDATAVHGLANALNRPQITQVVKDIQSDFTSLMAHSKRLFAATPAKPETAPSGSAKLKPLIYSGSVVIAGLGVHAAAPGLLPGAQGADLEFNFGSVQMKTANRISADSPVLGFPEISIVLHQIRFELMQVGRIERRPCGNLGFGAHINCTSKPNATGTLVRAYHIWSEALEINLFAETASTVVDIIGNLQDRLKDIDLSREVRYLQKIRQRRPTIAVTDTDAAEAKHDDASLQQLFSSMYSLEMLNIQISWIVGSSVAESPERELEDLVLSFKKIDLATRKENAARLVIEDFQLQMVPRSHDKKQRSPNSALLPEVVFNVAYLSTEHDRRLAFQAVGKLLDLRLTSQSILPASDLKRSIASSAERLRIASASWSALPTQSGGERKKILGNKRLSSLLVDADFAGAVVYIQGRRVNEPQNSAFSILHGGRVPQHGRYGQFTAEDASSSTTLRAPGVAFKVEYKDSSRDDPSLNAEVKVDASSNILYPTVVPLVMEMSSSIKEIVGEGDGSKTAIEPKVSQKFLEEDSILTADPTTILGKCSLNIGLRIYKQEFTLSCQPVARVAATARFDEIYIIVNTVKSTEHNNFFAVSATFSSLQASVQHVYSRESTGSFEVDSVVLSLMNSKHISANSGVSAILKISPMKAQINAKQSQDFLLFREIWLPAEMRQSPPTPSRHQASEPPTFLVQRYQQVAAAGAFPWNATVAIAELDIQLDLGQALGKSALVVSNFWVSSKKNSDWEQNLCLGFDKIRVDSSGRMSGLIDLQKFRVRTSIQWPERVQALSKTPLIQASLGFGQLRIKAAFDYQAFMIADIASFEFLMYNVRDHLSTVGDRLVAIVSGDKVQAFATTATASQGVALYQAFQRLFQEKKLAYESSLKDLEKFLRRQSYASAIGPRPPPSRIPVEDNVWFNTPISLHTDVVVTIKAINVGAFPQTFFDGQIFKIEATDAEVRFAVTMSEGQIHSGLGLTLGELREALAPVKRPNVPKTLAEVDVDEVIQGAINAKGGTILKVPRLIAKMQTWQVPDSTHIDYIFKSSFEGKVDVGWNYSRISFIRGMWESHTRALAHRLGKPLPQSAVQITGGPQPDITASEGKRAPAEGEQPEKITAVVNVPQSKYDYTALEPLIIETPQLRDLGEATPPLEWIGLHRERLPNLTHQIVIVTLVEVAREVEDAYKKILGSS